MKTYKQEFDCNGRHRLVCSDGRKTIFTGYRWPALLDDKVGLTAYFLPEEGIVSVEEYLKISCTHKLEEE